MVKMYLPNVSNVFRPYKGENYIIVLLALILVNSGNL
jgi:hypothetical protein